MAKGRESGMPDEAFWNTFFDPERVVAALDCAGSVNVVEFGCGYGTFTLPAAKSVSGKVFALDLDPAMIETTRRRALEAGLKNVEVMQRDFLADGSGLPDRSTGYAMLFNILHIEESEALLREAFRTLAPGGKIGIMHWKHDPRTPRGPSMEIRPRPEQCRLLAETAGFQFLRFEDLPCCPWHWSMVLQRPPE